MFLILVKSSIMFEYDWQQGKIQNEIQKWACLPHKDLFEQQVIFYSEVNSILYREGNNWWHNSFLVTCHLLVPCSQLYAWKEV